MHTYYGRSFRIFSFKDIHILITFLLSYSLEGSFETVQTVSCFGKLANDFHNIRLGLSDSIAILGFRVLQNFVLTNFLNLLVGTYCVNIIGNDGNAQETCANCVRREF